MRLCREQIGRAKAQDEFYLSTTINESKRCFYKYSHPRLATSHKCSSSGFCVGAGRVQDLCCWLSALSVSLQMTPGWVGMLICLRIGRFSRAIWTHFRSFNLINKTWEFCLRDSPHKWIQQVSYFWLLWIWGGDAATVFGSSGMEIFDHFEDASPLSKLQDIQKIVFLLD